ncbi:MAG: hypothetical protein AB8F34_07780 [Akkermansiaceae bacterium]
MVYDEQKPDPDESGFSLHKRIPQPPLPSQQSGQLIGWCRFLIWISPGPAIVIIGGGIGWLIGHLLIHPIFVWAAAFACTFGMGYCDAFLAPAVRKIEGKPIVKQALWHAFAFTVIQIFIAPVTIVALSFLIYSISTVL